MQLHNPLRLALRSLGLDTLTVRATHPNIDDINNLRAIRLCLLIQVGGRMDTPMDPPNGFEQCGNITINPEWRWYRWKLVEEDIPLRNIRR